MPKLNVPNIMEREAKAQARKDEWRSIYEDCYEFALPQRNLYSGYYEGKVAGKGKMARVFDSTAIHATQRFANRLQAGLFPPYKQWCRLEPGSAIPEDDKETAQELFDEYPNEIMGATLLYVSLREEFIHLAELVENVPLSCHYHDRCDPRAALRGLLYGYDIRSIIGFIEQPSP